MSEEEEKYIYRNRKGKVIYKPVYDIYNEIFFEPIIKEMALEASFDLWADTSLSERYMLNAAQFSAAKQVGENELLKKAVEMKDGSGRIRSFNEYRPIAEKITAQSRDTWLRVEYDTNQRNAVGGAQFRRMQGDKDLYPYWRYKGVMDSKERQEHREMEGLIFRIGDPAGDACFPVNAWNCRCSGVSEDGRYLDDRDLQALTNAQADKYLKENIDEAFRFNPAIQGVMPNSGHSYFEAFGNANEGTFDLFNLPPSRHMGFGGTSLEGLAATGLHYMINVEEDWSRQYHIGPHGTLIFQNQRLLTNVIWTKNSLHHVHQHQRGFENIPETITHPDEVWSSWEDPAKQAAVKRTYIKFGKTCYLVFTLDGVIKDAYALSPGSTDKHRKGVIL